MLWRRSARPLVIPPMAPVPDAEALRRAALQASWQRGRWVARRRLALRWVLWAATRYLMPALAVSGVAAWLWLGVLPGHSGTAAWLPWGDGTTSTASPLPATPAASLPPQATAVVAQEPPEMAPAPAEYSPEGEELPSPLALKFESRWAAVPAPRPVTPGLPSLEPDREATPSLKPENWLHSKEP